MSMLKFDRTIIMSPLDWVGLIEWMDRDYYFDRNKNYI